jgi:hypothetical protein
VDAADFDDLSSELVDSYLSFLRGRGQEPDLSQLPADQRRRLRDQFAIVSALADRAPSLPPVDEDPVALRLGLALSGAETAPDARAGFPPGSTRDPADPVQAALRHLEERFDRQVAVDRSPVWASWRPTGLSTGQPTGLLPVAQCSALGNSVALFTAATPAGEPAAVAEFLRQYPEISAVCLSTVDAREAVLLTAADANASVDPARGWLEPGVSTAADQLEVSLGRYFEARLPRWERVVAFPDLIDLGDVAADAVAVATSTLAAARRKRPQLQHRREAVAALRSLDPAGIGQVVADVQAGRLGGDALVARLSELAEAMAS